MKAPVKRRDATRMGGQLRDAVVEDYLQTGKCLNVARIASQLRWSESKVRRVLDLQPGGCPDGITVLRDGLGWVYMPVGGSVRPPPTAKRNADMTQRREETLSRPAWRCVVRDANGQTIASKQTRDPERVESIRNMFKTCQIPPGGRAEYAIRHVEGHYPRGRFVTHAVRLGEPLKPVPEAP
jgi:hypothetical protein